jgi:hypothetical protein
MGMGSGGFKSGTGNIPDLDVDSGTLSIDADNNRVGIGTTTPAATLDIDGDLKFSPTAITTAHITSAGSLTIRADANMTIGDSTADSIRIGRTNTALVKVHIRSGTDTDLVVSDSNVGIGTSTFDGSAAAYLTIANGTEPAAATADQIYIGSKDSTGLASDGATLSLRTEAAVQATALNAVGTLSHRTSIWINGTEYYLYLDPV